MSVEQMFYGRITWDHYFWGLNYKHFYGGN